MAWCPFARRRPRSSPCSASQACLQVRRAYSGSPRWVKACARAVYILVFQGAMAGGSILWGSIAASISVPTAPVLAAAGQAAALMLAFRRRLPQETANDLAPSNPWADPVAFVQPADDRGPVLIHIEYLVDPARLPDFITALRDFRSSRQRDGAIRWDVGKTSRSQGASPKASSSRAGSSTSASMPARPMPTNSISNCSRQSSRRSAARRAAFVEAAMTDRAHAEPVVPPPGHTRKSLEANERKTCHDHHHHE